LPRNKGSRSQDWKLNSKYPRGAPTSDRIGSERRVSKFRKREVTAPPKGGRIDDAPSPPEGEDKNSHIGVRSRLTTRQLLKRERTDKRDSEKSCVRRRPAEKQRSGGKDTPENKRHPQGGRYRASFGFLHLKFTQDSRYGFGFPIDR